MSISSSEINILIQRYFQELGYDHSAFAFGSESKIPHHEVAKRNVPPGSLVYLIQKGIMFSQIDAAAQDAISNPDELFGHELNYLRANLRQSVDIADEVSQATRRMKVFYSEQSEIQPCILSFQSSLVLQGHVSPVMMSAWNKSGEKLASGSCDGSVVIWSFNKIKEKDSFVTDKTVCLVPESNKEKHCDITALAWNDEDVLAVGVFSGLVALIKDNEIIAAINEHEKPVTSLCWRNGTLISGSIDGTIVFSKGSEVVKKVSLDGGELTDISLFSKNLICVASCGSNVFSVAEEGTEPPSILFQTKSPIVIMSADEKHENIVAGDDSGNVTIMQGDGTTKVDEISKAPVSYLVWAPMPNAYICSTCDGKIKMSNIAGSQPISFDAHKVAPYALAADPSGRFFASAAADGNICIWNISSSKMITAYVTSPDSVSHLSWSPTGRFLSISLSSGAVSILDFMQLC